MTNARDRNQRMKSLFANVNADELANVTAPPPAEPVRRVGSSAVKSMDRAFVSIEAENQRLHEQLTSAESVIELDPDKIEPSFIQDRLEIDSNDSFEAFMEGIRLNGQKLPILVRPLAQRPGYYQAAYGHRRLRACQLLKRPIKAIVRELTDEELVLSQGIENSERLNLSFIEQAFFALALKEKGYSRETISESLGRKEKKGIAYISHLTNAAAQLPEDLVRAIGPAPSIGRPKWEALGGLIRDRQLSDHQRQQLASLQSGAAWSDMGSDSRFNAVLAAFQEQKKPEPDVMEIPLGGGVYAQAKTTGQLTRISLSDAAIPGLAAWLIQRLPELAEEFRKSGKVG